MAKRLRKLKPLPQRVLNQYEVTPDNEDRYADLEAWMNKHLSGGRVSDLIAYAKAILEKYEPEALAGEIE